MAGTKKKENVHSSLVSLRIERSTVLFKRVCGANVCVCLCVVGYGLELGRTLWLILYLDWLASQGHVGTEEVEKP